MEQRPSLKVFGRPTCSVCKQAVEKINYFLDKWAMAPHIPVVYFDMDTVDGLSEGAFWEVSDIPTTLLINENGVELARWVKVPPQSQELKPLLATILSKTLQRAI